MIGWKSLFAASVALIAFGLPRASIPPQEEPDDPFVCPPCGRGCDDGEFESGGSCSSCGMELILRSTIPQVAIALFPGTDVLSFAGPARIFASTEQMAVFTVADTRDPLRCGRYLDVVPKFAFDDAPHVDLLIVPPVRPRDMQDEYLMGWLARLAEQADYVLTVGTGSVAAAMSGELDGLEVAAGGFGFSVQLAAQFAPDVTFKTDLPIREAGKYFTARDNAASIDAAFLLLALMRSEDTAQVAAKRLGYAWPRESR